MRQRLAVVAATSILALTAACGGGGDRPSTEEVADALRADESAASAVPDEAVDCVAEAFVSSDISDEGLQAIVDGEDDFDASAEDEEAAAAVTAEVGECITGAQPE